MPVNAPPALAAQLPQTSHEAAAAVATAQHDAMLVLLRSLDDADWSHPTDCTAWTVRDMVAHLVGALDEGARMRTFLRHAVTARRRYPRLGLVDGLNEVQIDERRDWSGPRLVEEFARVAPDAVRGRRRTPGLLRRARLPRAASLPPGSTVGYLNDVIYARDMWMHRVDIALATSRPVGSASSDAEVVAQVVRDLGRAWDGPPIALETTGPVEGTWRLGSADPVATVRVDVVELMRRLSGRPGAPSYDVVGDQSAVTALDNARVAF